MIGREREREAVHALLGEARGRPAVLILDGDPGIGKTTLCRDAAATGAASGFAVLSTCGAAAEVSLAWAALTDLIAGLGDSVLSGLSPLHQQTLQAVRTGQQQSGCDERLVATAFCAALEQLSNRQPVLIVIDDAQWLDEPSSRAMGFVMRRLNGPIAFLVAYRNAELGGMDRSWVHPPDPRALTRLTVGPMNPGDLRTLVAARQGQIPQRSAMERIYTVSAGNPFYALELARFFGSRDGDVLASLPPTLSSLVRDRIGAVDRAGNEVLVAAAAAMEPTVEIVAAATGRTPKEVVDILEPMESRGVLAFDGARIRFTHPLIASGIYTGADPAVQRRAHGRLADAVAHPEQRARHLALSSPHADAATLAALDAAAESAAARGAFSTAAELTRLALRLGGQDPMRQLRAADYHFRAGALDESEAFVAPIIDDLPSGFLRAVGLLLLAAVRGYRDGIVSAIELFERAEAEAEDFMHAQALLPLALATGIGGDMATAVDHARRAREEADTAGLPQLRSQARALWVYLSFIYGLGTDSETLRAAKDSGEGDPTMPVELQPAAVYAMHCAWTGRLEEARTGMTEVLRRCAERGNEVNVLVCNALLTSIHVALGHYDEADRTAAEAVARADQIGGLLPVMTAQTAVAEVAARRGRVEDAREAAELAVKRASAAGLRYHVRSPLMSLAFAQVSEASYDDALRTLAPLLADFDPAHDTEIVAGGWIPDAVEALTATGRVDDAERLTAALETNGARYARPWMLAVGARCRALVQAARGDVDEAVESAERAMEAHDRLPMPFERARTQLLVGELLRRRRRIAPARINIQQAVMTFEEIGSPLWLARAQSALRRFGAARTRDVLTDSERQVAEHAAAGRTNKQIAAALYLSTKTVEMHLSNAYRKLGIRSRAQLADGLRTCRPSAISANATPGDTS